jgi:protein phosphatase
MQNVLANALMSGDADGSKDASCRPETLGRGDVLLLASDGLHGYVSDAAIRTALLRQRPSRELCAALVGLAYVAGAPDNVTVLCVARR